MSRADELDADMESSAASRVVTDDLSPSTSQEGFCPQRLQVPLAAIRHSPRSISAASPNSNRREEGGNMLMKTQSAAEQAPTFAEAGDAVTDRPWFKKGQNADKRLLEVHVYPELGNVRVAELGLEPIPRIVPAVRHEAPPDDDPKLGATVSERPLPAAPGSIRMDLLAPHSS